MTFYASGPFSHQRPAALWSGCRGVHRAGVGGRKPLAVTVYGQGGSFTTNTANKGGLSASSLQGPGTVTVDSVGHRLFIADYSNNRVLIFNCDVNNVPLDDAADVVLGQPDFVTNSAGTSAIKMNRPSAILYDGVTNRLYVSEWSNHRVLVFENAETLVNGEAADKVLGQANFTTASTGLTASTFNTPDTGLAVDNDRGLLFVADTYNYRVLVFDVNSITDGEAATSVIGQADFTSAVVAITQNTLVGPTALVYEADRRLLFVADTANNRTMIFDLTTITNGPNAAFVLGPSTFTLLPASPAKNTTGFTSPYGLALENDSKRLYVSDYGAHRVLVFDTRTITNGEPAIDVIGQADFDDNAATTTPTGLSGPNGLFYETVSDRLYVSNYSSNRVTGYLMPSHTSLAAMAVVVDPSLTFSVASHSGTCNGVAQTAGASSTATAINLGRLTAGGSSVAAQDLVVSTNATSGYSVFMNYSGPLADGGGRTIADVSGTHAAPGAFTSAGPGAFGYTLSENGLPTGTADRFTNGGAKWAAPSTTRNHVAFASVGTLSLDTNCLAYRVDTSAQNIAGSYSTTVTYSAVPVF